MAEALRKETRAIFVETPVNPTCRVLDLRPVGYVTKEVGLALVVDSTFASPINLRPLEHGADVVIHSATKYLNGHHDVLGGVVFGTAPYIEEVRQKMKLWGQAPDPFACWLLERGLKTLDVRVKRQNENAMRIAEWCAGGRRFGRVHYPGLADHPDHEIAKSTMDGFGGMLAIELTGGARATEKIPPEAAHHQARTQPRRRRFARFRAALHVPRASTSEERGRAPAFPTASSAEHRHRKC